MLSGCGGVGGRGSGDDVLRRLAAVIGADLPKHEEAGKRDDYNEGYVDLPQFATAHHEAGD